MIERSCDRCVYFLPTEVLKGGWCVGGWCVRYPPAAVPTARSMTEVGGRWPVVFADEWCGEFSASEEG